MLYLIIANNGNICFTIHFILITYFITLYIYNVLVFCFFFRLARGLKKTSAQNHQKLTPPPCLQNIRTASNPPLSVRTYHNFRKFVSFSQQKLWKSASEPPMFVMDSPLVPDFRYLSWTALKIL